VAFPLINPSPTFSTSSGAPLVSGTIEFRNPDTDALINSYPTADDADAQTNQNDNPLTLNSRGEAPNGLFLEDGVRYKVTLKDSLGSTIWTRDDVQCPEDVTAEAVGQALYPLDAAETSAGLTASNITFRYPYGDIRRYGADTATADNSTALQNAINAAGHGGWPVYVPGTDDARFRHASTLYFFYDATNNTDFPSGTREDGRITIKGDGILTKTNFTNSEYRGSALEYTGTTGVGYNFSDGSSTEPQAIRVRDVAFLANAGTSGYVVQLHYAPQLTSFENVFMGNSGSGGVWSIQDTWSAEFKDIWCRGDGTNGTAIKYDPTIAGGGNTLWLNVNAEACDIGFDFGDAFSSSRTAFMKNHTFINCQGRENVTRNLRIRCGFASGEFLNFWSESLQTATEDSIELSNMAGFDDDLDPIGNRNPGLIRFKGGQYSWVNGTSGAGFKIGDSTATETTDSVGNIILDGVTFGQTSSGTDAIRRHNAQYNGYLKIVDPIFHNNSGQYLVIDDEAQYGPIFLENWEGDGSAQGNWVEDTAGADVSHWIARADNLIPTLGGNGTFDYSNAKYVPTMFLNQSGGNITITLPTSPEEQSFALYVATDNSNNLVIDPGAENLNGSTTDLTFTGKYGAVHMAWDDSRDWVAATSVEPGTTAYTPTNVSTDRAFDADSTTVEEVADVVGTLIADLQAKGVIS